MTTEISTITPEVLTDDARQSKVAEQYEQWPYPEPIQDLEAEFAQGKIQASAPRMVHWLYWPDGWYTNVAQEKIDILIAGCGANLAAQFAFTHPKANVVGIDLSESSLQHEETLKKRHNLTNLTLHQMKLEDVANLNQSFDFIDCAGVLHHLPEPETGLKALKTVLKPHGVISIMVYGLAGRAGLYMLQEAFQTMNVSQSVEDVDWVENLLPKLPESHPIHPFLKNNLDINYKAGIVDMFLHPLDKGYSVNDCLALVKSAKLTFQGWSDPGWYHPKSIFKDDAVIERINHLELEKRWQAMEHLNGGIRLHNFYLCHSQRDKATYQLDFESDAFLNAIPIKWVHHIQPSNKAEGKPCVIQRQLQPKITLDDRQEALFNQINNGHTIAQCIKNSGIRQSRAVLEGYAKQFFKELYDLGAVMFYMNQ